MKWPTSFGHACTKSSAIESYGRKLAAPGGLGRVLCAGCKIYWLAETMSDSKGTNNKRQRVGGGTEVAGTEEAATVPRQQLAKLPEGMRAAMRGRKYVRSRGLENRSKNYSTQHRINITLLSI